MKAATRPDYAQPAFTAISIHAAREGGDGSTIDSCCERIISIHAAREGGDRLFAPCSHCVNISIHAAREGGDQMRELTVSLLEISIHAAREGGDLSDFAGVLARSLFQSTPPVKAATIRDKLGIKPGAFQSTPPVKAATLEEGSGGYKQWNFNPRRP